MGDNVRIRPATADDIDAVVALGMQAFNIPESGRERRRGDFNPELTFVAETPAGVVATARMWKIGHYYGGRAIPASGVAGVAVAPEARGHGYGSRLMHELLRDQRAKGIPLSSLYPATLPIYRACGYGTGAIRTTWKASLTALPRERSTADVEPFDEKALDEVAAAYELLGADNDGLVVRSRDWWHGRVLRNWDGTTPNAYVVRESGRVTGWIVYSNDKGSEEWQYTLACKDLYWTTPGAARALLSFAALHRSTVRDITWLGAPSEPMMLFAHDHAFDHAGSFNTMTRLVDVPGAIEARGYNPHINAAVTIGVRDKLLPENDGTWRIDVGGGAAKVVSGGAPDATADVTTWAELWAGVYSTRALVRAGTLEASAAGLEALDAIFAGPMPWIADSF